MKNIISQVSLVCDCCALVSYSCVVVNIYILNPFSVYMIRRMKLDVKTFGIVCLEFKHVCLDFKVIYKHEERHVSYWKFHIFMLVVVNICLRTT